MSLILFEDKADCYSFSSGVAPTILGGISKMEKYPCPCCGYCVFEQATGSYNICPICFWEDDEFQLTYPFAIGANRVNLFVAQNNFLVLRTSEEKFIKLVRTPLSKDMQDPDWRTLDIEKDIIRTSEEKKYWLQHNNPDLYYWRWNK